MRQNKEKKLNLNKETIDILELTKVLGGANADTQKPVPQAKSHEFIGCVPHRKMQPV